MPNITLKVPQGVLDAARRQQLIAGITAAAARCEQIPDNPRQRFLCWVQVEEVASGHWACGGVDVSPSIIPVLARVDVPAGVLTDEARDRYVELVHRAVVAALASETRRITSSCIINEVPDGTWGADGALRRLPDIAAAAGFEHLQHLVRSIRT
jgi:phenylpyruvate tautomerase PptA (4-oxalocrotonate tautomerase family)